MSAALFDVTDPAFLADPYPAFAAARTTGEMQWHSQLSQQVALSHAACSAVLRNKGLGRLWADREPAETFPAFNLLHRHSLLESEPPTHTRLRRLVAGAFGRGHVERLRPVVATLAHRLVDELAVQLDDGADADLLETVAAPLPVEVIAELLGVPRPVRPALRGWSNAIVRLYEPSPSPQQQATAEQAAADFVTAMRELVVDRRRQPGDDLVSDLLAAQAAGVDDEGERGKDERLSDDELVATCALLLMAGHEATVNGIGNGVFALLADRSRWRQLVDGVLDPAPAAAGTGLALAAEELLRYDSPLQLFERTATRDVVVAGVEVAQGETVSALLGAAGRDPAVFADPDTVDLARSPNPHLGFGVGLHYCLGAPLARIELQSVLGALAERLPEVDLAQRPQRRPEFVIRGLQELRLRQG
ncbi:MAG: cytochrome P450 [Mycobacteriaceae bacterium]